jgi:hypothetical protein
VDDGFDVRVPALSMSAYRDEVARGLKDIVALARKNQNGILVLDDGGLVTELLHSDPAYADMLDDIKIVEQTTQGILAAEKRELSVPVVNVARSQSKAAEAEFIGQAVGAKLLQALRRDGGSLDGRKVGLLGYGMIGPAIASTLRDAGAAVTINDTSPTRMEEAAQAGFKTASKEDTLEQAEIVVGATGRRSVEAADMQRLKKGTVLVSATSKQVEIDVDAAAKHPVRLLNGGWPINFDGDVEDIPSSQIQITRAAMFAGAIQAAALRANEKRNKRIVPLDPAVDAKILSRFDALGRGRDAGEIGDPDRWVDVAREIDGRIRAELTRR